MQTDDLQGQEVVVLSGGELTAMVLPEIGAKIISLVNERTGREFIWRDPYRRLSPVVAGSSYADNDASGVDDCFPTVDPCVYPTQPFAGLRLGDHGDLWSKSWSWHVDAGRAVFSVMGGTPPYRFKKSMRIDPARRALIVDYELFLDGDDPFNYQWTLHPLLRAEKGMRIDLPQGVPARTAFATAGRLTLTDVPWAWPHARGTNNLFHDVSLVGDPGDRVNEKYWLKNSDQGCRLTFLTDEQLRIGCDPGLLPWLGVCVNYGGWPDLEPGYWVAVEPSTSPHDSLSDSILAGHARRIGSQETHRWSWSLSVSEPSSVSHL